MTTRTVLIALVAVPALALGLVACGNDDDEGAGTGDLPVAEAGTAQLLEPEQGQELIDTTEGEVVLDVRTPEEFAEGHLAGAINMNVEDPAFDQNLADLDTSATYVIYCRSGRRSAVAADRMIDAGFTSVYDLGGIEEWKAAGLPVES